MTVNIFYSSIPSSSAAYLFVAEPADYSLFSQQEFRDLPVLGQESYQKFLLNYNRIINAFWESNRDNLCFSYLPFSLKNTWQSSFYYGMESYARVSLLERGDIYFTSPHWFLWVSQNLPYKASDQDLRRAKRDIFNLRARRFIKKIRGVHFLLSQYSPRKKTPTGIGHSFFSIWTPTGQKKWQSSALDPFYENIPSLMDDSLLVYHLEGAQDTNRPDQGHPVALRDTSLLSLFDWISLIRKIVTFRVRAPVVCDAPLGAIEDDIAASVANQMVLGLISYYAATNIANKNNSSRFITLFEGNCWEQGVLCAAAVDARNVISIQHTAFSLGMLKMRAHDDIRRPSRIITTGPVVTDLLIAHMGYNKRALETGYRLRNDAGSCSAVPRAGDKILVLLQGAPHESLMLSKLERMHLPFTILVRDHPSQPLKGFAGFTRSRNAMAEDLKNAALVIYNGTTAVFDALLAGIPCIYFSCGDESRNDPLFDIKSAIKKECLDEADLPRLINEVINLSDDEYNRALKEMHNYIQGYFKSPTPDDTEGLVRILKS